MKAGLAEALLAYNMDVGDSGFSPMQAAVGRQPLPPGDALGDGRLGEIDAMEQPNFVRMVAVREAARMAMLRLHFSNALRKAEKARSRNPTVADAPCVGDLVYFWREQRYNRKASQNRRKLLLKRWHGPALMVAREGNSAYVTSRGSLTKVALEHVRRASPMEQIASGEWEEVIQEVVAAAERDQEWEMIGPRQAAQDDDGDGAGLPRQPSVPEPPPGANAGDEARLREEAFGELSVGDLPLDGTGLARQPSVPEPGVQF